MDTTQVALIVVAIVIVLLVVIAIAALIGRRRRAEAQRRRSEEVRGAFGPEYDRVVQRTGNPDRAADELEARQQRYRTYSIRELSDTERRQYAADWQRIQAGFVDRPGLAIVEADRLVGDLMRARGFPMSDADTAAADLSVEHADSVEAFRQGHAIATSGTTDAERLRIGMLMFRQVVERLLAGEGRVVDLRTPSETVDPGSQRVPPAQAAYPGSAYEGSGYEDSGYEQRGAHAAPSYPPTDHDAARGYGSEPWRGPAAPPPGR